MKIGIVNDMPLAVEALQRVVALKAEHEVIWVARNGVQAVDQCACRTPDLVLMDLIMPLMDGVEATRLIMADTPCAILVVTADVGANAGRVFEAMGHGALDAVNTPALGSGELAKTAAPLLKKIDSIARLIGSGQGLPRPAGHLPQTAAPDNAAGLLAIGASAGGPAALKTLLSGLPRDFPAAIVIVQHVDELFAPGMADWLSRESRLPVRVAREGDRLEAGSVLLAGSNDHLRLKTASRLGYTAEPRDHVYRPSVDVFFESVAQLWPERAVGVLLTGMGADGARGLQLLRRKGHHTIAQDRASSAVYGMPKAAAALDAAVDILPLDRIAAKVVSLFEWRA